MLNSNMNYPYPILRVRPIDYKESVFETQIQKDETKEGYTLSITYKVTNKEFEELIKKQILAYALQLQCISTWYRDLQISESNRQTIFIPL